MTYVTYYFVGFGVGCLPAIVFGLACGAFRAITDISNEIAT